MSYQTRTHTPLHMASIELLILNPPVSVCVCVCVCLFGRDNVSFTLELYNPEWIVELLQFDS